MSYFNQKPQPCLFICLIVLALLSGCSETSDVTGDLGDDELIDGPTNSQVEIDTEETVADQSVTDDTLVESTEIDLDANPAITYLQPAAPSLSFAIKGYQQLNLQWTAITGAEYILVVRTGAAVDWNPTNGTLYSIGTLDANHELIYSGGALSYAHAGLTSGTTYHYSVFAVGSDDGYSLESVGSGTAEDVGMVDVNFGTTGSVYNDFTSLSLQTKDHKYVDVDVYGGQYYASGYNTKSDDTLSSVIARYNSDGTLDTSYGVNGYAGDDLYSGVNVIESSFVDTDGSLYSAGRLVFSAIQICTNYKLNTDGSLNSTFGNAPPSGRFTYTAYNAKDCYSTDIISQGSSLIQIGYTINDAGNGVEMQISRSSKSTGALDTSFGTKGTGIDTLVVGGDNSTGAYRAILDSSNRILVAGYTSPTFLGQNNLFVVRYTADGILDTTFATGGVYYYGNGTDSEIANDIALQSDGSMIVAGMVFDPLNPGAKDRLLLKLTPDGVLDTTFATNGIYNVGWESSYDDNGDDFAESILILADDSIVMSGSVQDGNSGPFNVLQSALTKLDKNGVPDITFGNTTDGTTPIHNSSISSTIYGLAIDDNGDIVGVGEAKLNTVFSTYITKILQ
jgi:uncharacterized delta-60 repeat protein